MAFVDMVCVSSKIHLGSHPFLDKDYTHGRSQGRRLVFQQ